MLNIRYKSLEKFADRIESISYEAEDGIWIYLKDGWYNPYLETSMIHEYRIKDCVAQLKDCYHI